MAASCRAAGGGGDDIRFLLRLCQMVGEYAGDLPDTFFLRGKNTTVTGDNAVVTVDDNRIDKSELPQGGAQLVDLLRRVGPGVIRVRHQFFQRHKLQACCVYNPRSHQSVDYSVHSNR